MRLSDGWNDITDCLRIYVEDGKVLRGVMTSGRSESTVYPYVRSYLGGWDNVSGLTKKQYYYYVRRGNLVWR